MKRGSNTRRVIALMRKATTQATTRHGIGGRLKSRPRPAPTLAKVILEEAK